MMYLGVYMGIYGPGKWSVFQVIDPSDARVGRFIFVECMTSVAGA